MTDPRVSMLRRWIEDVEKIPGEQRFAALDVRKKKELQFHDHDRNLKSRADLEHGEYSKLHRNKKYYRTTGPRMRYLVRWIERHASDKIFLDYACGNGGNALRAAARGAALALGLDLSPVSVANAKAQAAAEGWAERTLFYRADAERTELPARSIDSIVCSGTLHHLALSQAFPELRRILAPGGRILAVEALNYNPLIRFYRATTPRLRTEWERTHILTLKDLIFARRFFRLGEVRYWNLVNIAPLDRVFPAIFLEKTDETLCRIPVLNLLSWTFTFELLSQD